MTLPALDRLRLTLRPPGLGTQRNSYGAAARLLKALYGSDSANEIESAWEDSLQRIRRVDTILIGVPCDTGASLVRGASFAPLAVREAHLARYGKGPKNVIDVGDVVSVQELLHDDMLSRAQCDATRNALYGARGEGLPVSPLSVARFALEALLELNPELRICVLGGDGSVAWPAVECLAPRRKNLGILQIDSRPDLKADRLGVRYCQATWARHAAALVQPMRLVQVGLQPALAPRERSEELSVLQLWTDETRGRENETIDRIVQHFQGCGVAELYVSNDFGATRPDGLSPAFIVELFAVLRSQFRIAGGDVVEIAPRLETESFETDPRSGLGADYLQLLLA